MVTCGTSCAATKVLILVAAGPESEGEREKPSAVPLWQKRKSSGSGKTERRIDAIKTIASYTSENGERRMVAQKRPLSLSFPLLALSTHLSIGEQMEFRTDRKPWPN